MQLPDWISPTNWLSESETLRRYTITACVAAGGLFGLNWLVAPSEAELVAEGRELFAHEWTPNDPLSGNGDGLGPVFNEKSCAACHFQGGVGGAGGVEQNVAAFRVLPNRNHDDFRSGVIHASATDKSLIETKEIVRAKFPVVPESTRLVGGCSVSVQSFDPLILESINTPALFGVGLIDQISSHAINSNLRARSLGTIVDEFGLDFESTPTGRVRKVGLARVGKFGWRGQFANLDDFVASACAVELGLTNAARAQDKPQQHVPDSDAEYDMTSRQLDALVAYCRNLPRPEQVVPADKVQRFKVLNGETLFKEIGCADCHTPDIGGVDGIYTDFALHIVESDREGSSGYFTQELEVPIPDDLPTPDEWQTPPLWGVADSAPYFHDGGSVTLEDAILRHGAQARNVQQKFKKLGKSNQGDIICFLKSLRAPATAEPASVPAAQVNVATRPERQPSASEAR